MRRGKEGGVGLKKGGIAPRVRGEEDVALVYWILRVVDAIHEQGISGQKIP